MTRAVSARQGSGSLCLHAPRLLRGAIRLALATPFGPAKNPQSTEFAADNEGFRAGRVEYLDGDRFARRLGGAFSGADLAGRRVLDLGCGYGGRTVFYSERYETREMVGLETTVRVVERCRAFTVDHGAPTVSFVVGTAEKLPFTDGRFDAIVCFDVLEHVDDPARAFAEIERVLAPGGRAWLVFPSYLGARSSHLDYVTRLPALHRIFDPSEIIEVVNVFLREQPTRFATLPQPPPHGTALGRLALPGLNGMQWRDVDPILARSGLVRTRTVLQGLVTPDTPIPRAPMLSQVTQAVGGWLGWPELLIGSIGLCVERDAA